MARLGLAEILVFGLIALVVAAIANPAFRDRIAGAFRRVRLWHALALAIACAIVVASWPGPQFLLAMAAIVVLCGVAWFREFRFLMQLRDDDFPGRFDKLIWALALIVLPPVGVPTFWSYRLARWPEAKPSAEPAHDLA